MVSLRFLYTSVVHLSWSDTHVHIYKLYDFPSMMATLRAVIPIFDRYNQLQEQLNDS